MYSSSRRPRGGRSAGTTIILGGGRGGRAGGGRNGGGGGGGGGAANGVARIFTRSLRGAAGDGAAGFVTSHGGLGRERAPAASPRTISIAGAARAAAGSPYSRGSQRPSRKEAMEGRWGHDMFDPFEEGTVARNRPSFANRGATWAGKAARLNQDDFSKRKLTVENLHYEVLEDDLTELFGSFGSVVKVVLHYDHSGRSTGRADITFADASGAESAMNALNNRLLDGQPMQIKYFERPPPKATGLYSSGRSEKTGGIFDRLGDAKHSQFGGSGRGRIQHGSRRKGLPPTVEDLDADMDAYMKG